MKITDMGNNRKEMLRRKKKNENEINDLGITLTYLWEFFIILIQFRLEKGKLPAAQGAEEENKCVPRSENEKKNNSKSLKWKTKKWWKM